MGITIICEARKYIAFNGKDTNVFHAGYHTGMAKPTDVRPTELVFESKPKIYGIFFGFS